MPPFDVFVPATSANLGPGLDALGMALSFGNRFGCRDAAQRSYRLMGAERPLPDEQNLFWIAAERAAREIGRSLPPLEVVVQAEIPLARGLGSSASAVVGGLLAANHVLGGALAPERLLELASELEGHPDNVAPALLGGVTIAVGDAARMLAERLELPVEPGLVVAVPEFELSTSSARSVLPLVVPRSDAVYNVGRAALLVLALTTGRHHLLKEALVDRLHEPYRLQLVPGMGEVAAAARQAGAWGVTLSGAGPSLLAWVPPAARDQVARAMLEAWRLAGVGGRTLTVTVASQGARVGSRGTPWP